MSKFTEGPWYVAHINGNTRVLAQNYIGFGCDIGWQNVGKNEANARLIAAAPEMYEFLKKFMDIIALSGASADTDRQLAGLVLNADVLIQKIEGEE